MFSRRVDAGRLVRRFIARALWAISGDIGGRLRDPKDTGGGAM